jgi:tripartite-type tricarboxylate transporter receptor subunit TctC
MVNILCGMSRCWSIQSGALRAVALVVAATALMLPARAPAQQKFPTKPIRLVTAFTPGGTTDILARLIAPGMVDAFGQPLVLDARPGASGTLAAAIVSKAPPDGYTLLATSAAFAITAVANPGLPYQPLKDFAGVGEIGFGTTVLVVAPSLGVKSVKELVAHPRAKAGSLLFGSVGAFSSTHLNAERFRLAAGFNAKHVGFKGQSEFVIEIVAERIQFGSPGLMVALPFIRDRKLIPLVVASQQRSPNLPDVPAAPEVLPAWGRDGSQAWLAPAGTPLAIRQKISREMARNLALPDVKIKLQNLGFTAVPTSPEEHEKSLRNDLAMFAKIVSEAGLKPK